jgi:hypothetical protein
VTEPTPSIKMLRTIEWEHGQTRAIFYAGEVLSPTDQRAAGGFAHVALSEGWAELFTIGPALNRAAAPPRTKAKGKR